MSSRSLSRRIVAAAVGGLLSFGAGGPGVEAQAPPQAPPPVVARFVREANPIALRGPARPSRYMEASGRKAALLGRDGGRAGGEADLALVVPGRETARIQEVHITIGHVICEMVDRMLFQHPT